MKDTARGICDFLFSCIIMQIYELLILYYMWEVNHAINNFIEQGVSFRITVGIYMSKSLR